MPEKKLGLNDAYAVSTPDDNRALYKVWASTYELDFTHAHGYVYHDEVSRLFAGRAADRDIAPDSAILDVGCGTGIVGESLKSLGFRTIDGIDISPEMLDQAAQKAVYRQLIEVDVTQSIAIEHGSYSGVVSAGTFTHGHLGPEPIRELARLGATGAVFAIGINAEHYQASGFDAVLAELEAEKVIAELTLEQIPMYRDGRGDHAHDLATVALFQRT